MPEDELTPEPPHDVLALLERGQVVVLGRMPWSSNATFLVEVCDDGTRALAIYKPERGERPLWDFPRGLGKREVAAYILSEELGWGIVPETVLRSDAPLGEGSLQRFVEADVEAHYFTLQEDEEGRWHDQLRRICAFDLLVNNTDRKSGHCLLGTDGRIYAIDNGLAFHAEPKLRTVIWEYGGEAIEPELLEDVERLVRDGLPGAMKELLDPFERDAVLARGRAMLGERRYPIDRTGRRYPWPLV